MSGWGSGLGISKRSDGKWVVYKWIRKTGDWMTLWAVKVIHKNVIIYRKEREWQFEMKTWVTLMYSEFVNICLSVVLSAQTAVLFSPFTYVVYMTDIIRFKQSSAYPICVLYMLYYITGQLHSFFQYIQYMYSSVLALLDRGRGARWW